MSDRDHLVALITAADLLLREGNTCSPSVMWNYKSVLLVPSNELSKTSILKIEFCNSPIQSLHQRIYY